MLSVYIIQTTDFLEWPKSTFVEGINVPFETF
jgi:hypothetical protein